MSFDSSVVTNIFLACVALTNVVILAIVYQATQKTNGK
jgi:hypothetical protein